jgi:hypothetical protein
MTPRKPALWGVLAAALLLTACVTREEIAARKAAAEQVAQAEREKHCTQFGNQPGTPAYSKCLENLYLQEQQLAVVEEANRQARLRAAAQSFQQAGAALQNINPPPSSPIRCNTIPTGGGTSSTTCQ